ncbi:hypothetical protein RFI_38958 [Reticulomyxa filosa]|uniref:Uncharacterized protein n=1 Tax=Reticulomyxa filosa TaxID=46433 RepID=X6LCR0_RETFI|nr:hypothetical protein RFI_38958 [Reticulomyxa filosa]|eukprot:ETN98534.1 hypothetical protein RFI_38958 [Reticulomyxa filosa]
MHDTKTKPTRNQSILLYFVGVSCVLLFVTNVLAVTLFVSSKDSLKQNVFVIEGVIAGMYKRQKSWEYEKYFDITTNFISPDPSDGRPRVSFPGATILPSLDERVELGYLLLDENKTVGIEVGVQRGAIQNSFFFLMDNKTKQKRREERSEKTTQKKGDYKKK